jgi:hypothetical protein
MHFIYPAGQSDMTRDEKSALRKTLGTFLQEKNSGGHQLKQKEEKR